MAGKTAELRNSFSRGVIDQLLYERIDLEHYYLGLAKGTNLISFPQGGVERRPGTWAYTRLRRKLAPIPLSAGMITVHNGGTPANLVDQDPNTAFTTNAVAAAPFVVCEVDFGAAKTVCFCDVGGYKSGTAVADRCLAVEYWSGSAWVPLPGSGDPSLSPYRSIRTAARNRRFGGAPGQTFTSQFWRVTLYAATSTVYNEKGFLTITSVGTVTIGGLRFWSERPDKGMARYISFAKDAQSVYEAVLTDRNIDIFKLGLFYASVPVDVPDQIVRQCKFEQSLDTLLVFHKDVALPWIVRQGAHDEWNAGSQTFANLPALSANTAFSSSQNEAQQIAFSQLSAGDVFCFGFGSMITGALTYSTPSQLATDLVAALDALPGVTNEINAVVSSASPVSIGVGFYGANGGRRWPPLSLIPMAGYNTAAATSIVQRGLNAAGKIMGEDTGWPSCGVVHQSRLMMGGFRAAPSTWLMSRAGALTDFTLSGSPITADMGIQGAIDSDQVEEIRCIFVGQRLHLFTTKGEWWSDNVTFDATKTTDIILATRNGIAPNVAPLFVQNGTLFVQDGGQDGALANTVVRDFTYNLQVNNYSSEPISLLGGHLFSDIVSIAHEPGVTAKNASLIFFANSDGGFQIMTLLKSQDVASIMPQETQGKMIDVGCDFLRNTWGIFEREDGAGNADNYLELFDGAAQLDCAQRFAGPVSSVTLWGPLVGREVWAYIDGEIYGPLIPNGATLALPVVANEIAIVGLDFRIHGETLPYRPNPKAAAPFRKMVRVFRAEFSLFECGPVLFSANDQPFEELPTRFFDGGPLPQERTGEEPANDSFDVPMMDRLYSGYAAQDGLRGWTRFGRVAFTQPCPAPFKLRSIRSEIAYG
jgi:hypothetical protein